MLNYLDDIVAEFEGIDEFVEWGNVGNVLLLQIADLVKVLVRGQFLRQFGIETAQSGGQYLKFVA